MSDLNISIRLLTKLSTYKVAATPLEAVRACHPHLSLPEIARLWSRIKLLSEWRECLEQLWPTYQLRWNRELEVTLEKLVLTPRAFQDWCTQKQVGAQDLSPLRSVSNPEAFALVLLAIGHSVLSKNLGIQVLEWTDRVGPHGCACGRSHAKI
ncbi:MAG: hypothetical protein IPL83_06250 [Bdellovibrionales bacterium]|nr:hypothetical protein [Bdellovibrionales bacterium]